MIMDRLWNSRRWQSALIVVGLAAIGILPWVASSALADTPGGWTSTESIGTARQNHAAGLLPNGKGLIAGGEGRPGPLASAELCEATTGTFTPPRAMSVERGNPMETL